MSMSKDTLSATLAREETTRRSTTQKVLLATGFAGVLFIGTFVVLGALAPNYSSLREAISALEFTSLSMLQRANFFFFGLLLCVFAVALRRELRPGPGDVVVPLFQTIAGLAVIGDAIFIHFPLHVTCDFIAFLSTLTVLFAFAWLFRRDPNWRGWTQYTIATAVLMMLFLTAFGYANHPHASPALPAGLMEKLVTAIRTLWSVLFTARLLSGARLNFAAASRTVTG